ncbi:hypothetical protein [Ornithinimicrobium kibberense]|uniref:hypothetical protein n=1 Tax=Ornithinimicrobium kibberense TaxID=282060 RepID=UPI0036228799
MTHRQGRVCRAHGIPAPRASRVGARARWRDGGPGPGTGICPGRPPAGTLENCVWPQALHACRWPGPRPAPERPSLAGQSARSPWGSSCTTAVRTGSAGESSVSGPPTRRNRTGATQGARPSARPGGARKTND